MQETEKGEENRIEETEVKLGLEMSDVDDYEINGGEVEESLYEDGKKKKHSRASAHIRAAFLAGFLCCVILFVLASLIPGIGHFVGAGKYKYYRELDEAYGKYFEIMKLIGEDPIAEKDAEEISDEELKEIVEGIGDPYAAYYTAEEYEDFMKRYSDSYVGIGIVVMMEDGSVVVKSVIEDSPAADAGLKVDDVIVSIDGKTPADLDEAVDMIGGEVGTKVSITVNRDGKELELEAVRDKIEQDSVGYSKLKEDPEIGYILIGSFKEDTSDEFKLAVRDLKSEGCDKFIIDLRNNGGGLTDESIKIADYLLPACRIMSEVNKAGDEKIYNSKASSADLDCVILVNENTASASEILTAALQDNDGGTVIGKKTYGKGVTQITHRFKDGSAIKITSTEYFRPNGGTVQGVGITPDIEAEYNDALDAAIRELKQ